MDTIVLLIIRHSGASGISFHVHFIEIFNDEIASKVNELVRLMRRVVNGIALDKHHATTLNSHRLIIDFLTF